MKNKAVNEMYKVYIKIDIYIIYQLQVYETFLLVGNKDLVVLCAEFF